MLSNNNHAQYEKSYPLVHILSFIPMFLILAMEFSIVHASGKVLDGYESAKFGMSANEILNVITSDGLVKISDEVHEGDREIQASRDRGWIKTNIVYVLPKNRDKLALVIEIYPNVVSEGPLKREFQASYGAPISEDISDEILKELKQHMPNILGLTIWAETIDSRGKLLRLLRFPDHLAVEYLEPELLE